MRSFRVSIALIGTLVAPGILSAQRQVYTNTNAWFQFTADVAIDQRWGILFDASARRATTFDDPLANFVRAGVAYAVNPNVRVAVGGNYSKSYPYGEVPSPYAVPEWRLWEQLQLAHSLGKFDLTHRYRFEQRLRGLRTDPDVDETDNWTRFGRFRYQVKGTLPLVGEDVEAGEPYLSVANEIFLSYGKNVQFNIFDQDRATVMFGYRMNRNWRAETGFMEQIVLKSNGVDMEHNHTLMFGLTYNRAAPRPEASGAHASP